MNPANPNKSRKLWLLAAGVVIAIMLAMVTGSAMLASSKDGLEQYTGVRRDIASRTLQWDDEIADKRLILPGAKRQVVKVEPIQGNDEHGATLACTDDPNDMRHYSVTIKKIWLFNVTYDSTTYLGCNVIP